MLLFQSTIISSNAPLADFNLDYAEMTTQAFASESVGDPSLRWQSIAHVLAPVGAYAVSNINLGRFDPTILQNGTYVLRVSAYDSNRRGQQEEFFHRHSSSRKQRQPMGVEDRARAVAAGITDNGVGMLFMERLEQFRRQRRAAGWL